MKKFIAKHRESVTGACFILPGLLYVVLLVGYPIVYNLMISFKDLNVRTIQRGAEWVGLQNYVNLFKDGLLTQTIGQTFLFTAVCIVVQMVFGLALAVFFNRDFKCAKVIRGMLLVIWVVPMTVTAIIYKFMFQTDGGLINTLLMNLHLIKKPIEWLINGKMAMAAVIFANSWVGIPFYMILLTSGLNGISPEIYESAEIDGANAKTKFMKITLPLLKPSLLSTFILGVIYTFKVFELVVIMTNGGPNDATELLSTYSYKLSFGQYQFSQGAAVANILFLCLLVVTLIYLRFIKEDEVM